jgi:hypothetical protein
MIISNSRKFIFVHINKTAGTSITEALAPHLAWNDLVLGSTPIGLALNQPFHERFGLSKHSTARGIRAVVGERVWSEYRSFAVVRDPVDRALSLYGYLKMLQAGRSELRKRLRSLLGARGGPDWLALRALKETGSFSEFIRHPELRHDPGFVHQSRFLSDETGALIVDRLLRFETLAEDFAALGRELGIPEAALGHQNRSQGGARGREAAVSERDVAFLKDYFAEDYALLARLAPAVPAGC